VDREVKLWVLVLPEERAQPGTGQWKESIIVVVGGRGGVGVESPL